MFRPCPTPAGPVMPRRSLLANLHCRKPSCSLVVGVLGLAILAGCGETKHPVRTETMAPPSQESDDSGTSAAGSSSTLPAGHPPVSAMQGEMPPMAPAGGEPSLETPESWIPVAPGSRMVQAEFELPKAEGDEDDGTVTVMMAGGSVEANVERWRTQFEDLEEKPVESVEFSGTNVAFVDMSGTFNLRRGMFGPATKHPNYRMLAAIVELPEGKLFVKGWGPKETMAKHAQEFRAFVESLATPGSHRAEGAETEDAVPPPEGNSETPDGNPE